MVSLSLCFDSGRKLSLILPKTKFIRIVIFRYLKTAPNQTKINKLADSLLPVFRFDGLKSNWALTIFL